MAINVSNPTTAVGRVSAGKLLEGRYYFLRQDLSYLKSIASGVGQRVPLSALPQPPPEIRRALLQERDAVIASRLPQETVNEYSYPLPKHPDGAVPICNLRVEGVPLRPTKVKCKGNAVALTRRFGSSPGHPPLSHELDALLTQFSREEVRETLMSVIFTAGTKLGFERRLELITSPHCRSITQVVGTHHRTQMEYLERLLPVDLSQLPDWMGGDGDLLTLLSEVDVTSGASAGAPYWRKKGDCLEQVFYVVELIATHIKDGTLDSLLMEQPELFLIECKNKTDRYKIEKLDDKTRPYFNPPAHWSILASFLFQGFSRALRKVGGGVATTNAYGWSAAKGGIDRLVEDVKRRFKGGERGWCYVYGDDGDVYFVVGGKLYRASPDIKQMDSCVDFDTVVLTYKYLSHVYTRAHGESRMWDMIIDALVALQRHPRIMVSGTQLYTKEADGLLSGIVGTTVFDTVKASVCYTDMLEKHAQDPSKLLNSDYVKRFLYEAYGLNMKDGTWEPELVNLDPVPAAFDQQGNILEPEMALFGTGKFLGINYVRVQGPSEPQWLPWLPEEDWRVCVLSPRMDDGVGVESQTARLRTQFDRIRGYLTTGAAFSPKVRRALEYWVDTIPSEVILMQPQGTRPPEGILFGEGVEWEYPTPEFVPTWEWVFNIYATESNQFDAPKRCLFSQEVMDLVTQARLKRRKVNMKLENGEARYIPFEPKGPLSIGVELEAVVVHKPPELTTHWKGPTPKRVDEFRPSIPQPGLPLDLALEQTKEKAIATALNVPPPPSFLNVQEQVLLSTEAKTLIVDEPPKARLPKVMEATSQSAPKVAHSPTFGGALGPPARLDATLVVDYLAPLLTKFVSVPPELTVSAAAHYICRMNLIQFKFKGENIRSNQPGLTMNQNYEVVEAKLQIWRLNNEHYTDAAGRLASRTIKCGDPRVVQVWHGLNMRTIREAFAVWISVRNKALAAPVMQEVQSKDWAAAATPSVAPYSEVKGDKRPPPPAQLYLPQCPTTVPVERSDGNLEVILPPALPPPPNDKIRPPKPSPQVADAAPAPPPGPLPPKPRLPREENTEVRHGRRIYVKGSDTEDSDAEMYENAISVPPERGAAKTYLGLGEIDEVLKSVGRINSGSFPNNPQPSDRYTIENLKRLLNIVTHKHQKRAQKNDKKENASEDSPPPLPPRKDKPTQSKEAKAKGPRYQGRPRSPNSDRRGGNWRQRTWGPRAGNRPALVPGGAQR